MMYSVSRIPSKFHNLPGSIRLTCLEGLVVAVASGGRGGTRSLIDNCGGTRFISGWSNSRWMGRRTISHASLSKFRICKSYLEERKRMGYAWFTQDRKYSVEKPVEDREKDGADLERESAGSEDDEYGGLSLTDEEMEQLTNGDPELVKKVKYIQLEHVVLRQEGSQVPSRIKFKQWQELLPLDSKNKRRKYFLYLFKLEMKQQNRERKKVAEREQRMKEFAENPLPRREDDPYGMCYGLARNTLFLRLYDTTVNRHFHHRLSSAMLHSPPLVIDCSYDEYMTAREAKNCAKQIELLITENRTHQEPFNLYLCNADRTSKTVEYLRRIIPIIDDDSYVINLHEECFTQLLPKNRLVYLTPHTRDELEEYSEDDIYIIGAMVDKSDPRPYSLAKAKKLGLTMRRLPLDKHLMWGLGGKSLTLNQMVRIMLDLRHSRGDWKVALKNVPMRKLCRDFHPYPDQIQNQDDSSPRELPQRKERKSLVLEDYELLNKRKGFRRSADTYSSKPSFDKVKTPRMRSLLSDDD